MEEKGFDYMNVIPLVDVMLVLLTIVLTTSAFIASGAIPVELPRVSSKNSAEMLKTRTIEIDRGGNIYLDSRPVSLDGMTGSMKGLDRDTAILIRADRSIVLQRFVDVLDRIKGLGFKRLSLQTTDANRP
ncbi:MAG: ExbD/TolR family protein [Dissulfurimicrobium sp.]|uniref:ExbD/TolR family protein n=1 Tax=Dissulfurimicrobium TaxID=1769732 RepID=UPI001EDC021A|nr:biopolymer transporter ExbD [Dissulfurimicrobium hydrothermale]UKL13400.1 biopolymer transporter ExbD [Dissulfurimicrobium hydrothermale]